MKHRSVVLFSTHLAALGLAYAVARGSTAAPARNAESHAAAKSHDRERRPSSGDGAALLSEYLKERQVGSTPESPGSTAAPADAEEDFKRRVEAMWASDDHAGKDHQSLVNELIYQDLRKLLNEGRDWRFEFRHGVAPLDEVVAAVRAGMPGVPPEGEEALVVSLFRHLVEEDTRKALPLLDSLPEDKRREALFHSTWLSQVNIDPDDFLAFTSSLPEPLTPEEKDLRTKGWNWKARGFLMRFGDDYVEWVKEMPEGLDKETAMNSLIWATREQNPAEARKLNEQLYPARSDDN